MSQKINKSDMEENVTYLLCPDKSGKLFWEEDKGIPCESECPHQDELVKIIRCHSCYEPIKLPGNHPQWENVLHIHEDGTRATSFARMSGKYALLYERPM